MSIRVFIDGAAGTTGLEIHDRLSDREEFELLLLDDAQRKDEAARRDALHAADVAILCLPDAAAREAVALAAASDTRIIDASSAHRVAEGWTYGFPEIIGHEEIADAQLVSNPGCYPTGFLALIAPLIESGLLPDDYPFAVHAVSGYSGGGKALIERFEKEPDLGWRGYGFGMDHKHLPEMEIHGGLDGPPIFSPAVVPVLRGMVVEVPVDLGKADLSASPEDLHEALSQHYAASNIVTVSEMGAHPDEIVLKADAQAWDGMTLSIFANPDEDQVRLLAKLDNLGKGASGAAIQNLNIMCGLPETTGLRL